MKSTTNRYRPPRVQYKIDSWAKEKTAAMKARLPEPKTKKQKPFKT
jgi:hypothetical protein